MQRRPRAARLLSATLAIISLSGCSAISGLVAPIATQVAGSVAPGLVSALLQAAAGELLPPPKNTNQNLAPVFLKSIGGGNPSGDEVQKVLDLCNGVYTSKLPAVPGRTNVVIVAPPGPSNFGLLGAGFHLQDESATQQVGLGASSPQKAQRFDLLDAALFDNAPILAAILGVNGQYKVLDAADTVDLRSKMPPVRNQGQRGTCVIFACAGILDYMYANSTLPIKNASPEFLDWLYQMEVKTKVPEEQPTAWQDSGTVPEAFYPLLHIDGNREVTDAAPYIPPQQGYVGEDQCPYNATLPDATTSSVDLVQISHQHLGDTLAASIAAKQTFASQGAYFFRVKMDAPSFESALAGGQPIQLGFPVYAHDWDKPDAGANFVIPEMTDAKAADSANIGYHSVDIVGYERNSAAPGGGYFIIRNSWGPDWGDSGYCRVSYDTTLKYAQSPYVATPYAASFNAQYDLAPPPKDAPPEDQVLAARPLATATTESSSGSYTANDRTSGQDVDTVFAQFLSSVEKSLGIKLPF